MLWCWPLLFPHLCLHSSLYVCVCFPQVLQQQQQERENQLVLQREQLAQQKSQLDQIQSLQQQLQQQLQEQKRQKTANAQGLQVRSSRGAKVRRTEDWGGGGGLVGRR